MARGHHADRRASSIEAGAPGHHRRLTVVPRGTPITFDYVMVGGTSDGPLRVGDGLWVSFGGALDAL